MVRSCTIVTTEANGVLRPIHDRMPVLLSRDAESRWLDDDLQDPVSRAAAKHTTVAERKCTTGVMPEGADLGVGVATGTVVGGPWEDYGPACSGAEDSVAFCRLPLRR